MTPSNKDNEQQTACGPLSKLTITEGGQQATQYKKIIDALPVFCADKRYKFIDDVIWTNTEQVQAAFMPTYPNAILWSNTYHVQSPDC